MRAINDDELIYERKNSFLFRLLGINEENEGSSIYMKEMVDSLATGRYCSDDEVIGRRGQKISFKWEPSLPPASRK